MITLDFTMIFQILLIIKYEHSVMGHNLQGM